ncbi:MAG: cation:proton antiporter [Pseudomonadota bacterium]
MSVVALIHASPFYEIAALIALATVIGFVGQFLRQPMIVSLIAVGVLAGPSLLGIVRSHEQIDLLAELGIAVLLFLVGLKLDIKLVRTLGPVALATGIGQVAFTSVIGYGIGLALGMDHITAIYVAVALTFSSTIIIVKLLSDKREVDALHGRIAIGFLIVQDLVVVLAMIVLSSFGVGETGVEGGLFLRVATILGYGLIAVLLVLVFIRFGALAVTSRMAHSRELLVTFAIGWAALLAALGDYFGFSKELGGLLAGISLASTPIREALVSRLSPLRDFLLLFFFIALGTQLDFGLLGEQILPAIVFSLFVLVGNPLIVLIIMGLLGYRSRTGFLAGLTVAQISEFSLIFMAMGLSLGHVSGESLALVTLVGLITISLSVYMITWSHTLYGWLGPLLTIFERAEPYREAQSEQDQAVHHPHDIVLFGLGRYGRAIADQLVRENERVLALDFDPEAVRRARATGIEAIYGDASDQDFVRGLPLGGVRWVICAIPANDVGVSFEDPRRVLLDELAAQGFAGRIAISTHEMTDVDTFRRSGADIVLLPYMDGATLAVERVQGRLETTASDELESAG